ncbi:ABC-transporter [Aspergillus eucalypticola CBS 122712]|uniref:ABC-transporter n=1 Tax=Aspergillus eucalypticola (strain CBS 122712 / IBT 29274) TaxID=1448314 RepID=A0A317V730_ASPEC|nr:ABC-transporter [Aspergillus eucalypticola CBS 122712]PWY68767.1 ABC-transporter [Aspergillus eucalypticola CBS 122712]
MLTEPAPEGRGNEEKEHHNSTSTLSGHEQEELRKIASRQSAASTAGGRSLKQDFASLIDPTSPHFDLSQWMLHQVQQFEGDSSARKTGVVFRDVTVQGSGSEIQTQHTVLSSVYAPVLGGTFSRGPKTAKTILHDVHGHVEQGEMLLVLGRPGAGCSTMLKTISAETNGLDLSSNSVISYSGIPQPLMKKNFKGELLYNQEVEKHFPHLTVGETLNFAATARTPRLLPNEMSRKEYIRHIRDVVMAVFGLSHTVNTKVGSDFVRGVSGGERKRVSIAEMALAGSPLCCWDNATRGLDSASSLDFVKALKTSSRIFGTTHVATLYQPSQAVYNCFDKVMVLYQGHEIYFGPTTEAKHYFEDMGWYCPARQTTADFLTSITNPSERQAREGYEEKVPRTPEEFEVHWRSSASYKRLGHDISSHEAKFGADCSATEAFKQSHAKRQARYARSSSPYLIDIPTQIGICASRFYQRVWNDIPSTLTLMIGQIVFSIIIGSLFYGGAFGTEDFTLKMSALFFAILLNSLLTVTEIQNLYAQRPIVEKQASYAFYHPFTEALAGVCADIPIKVGCSLIFNIVFYFMCGFRYEAGPFFVFYLFVTMALLCMSQIFRSLAAATKAIPQALAAAGVILLATVIYTGYLLPLPSMHPWFKWISYINPLRYAFEALAVNEFHGRDFPCSDLVPLYPGLTNGSGTYFICAAKGAVAGELYVNGDNFLSVSYGYEYSHLWRNFGILCAFIIAFLALYLLLTEINSHSSSTAESLVFQHGRIPVALEKSAKDPKAANISASQGQEAAGEAVMPPHQDTFMWREVCYDIKIKKEERRLLDKVSGWVEPGTLTALMGVSGAGKTTLLNVLAQRTSTGVITGDMLVNGSPLSASFQRSTGYVQQQDLHLHTATVRESLRFSALLRQPKSVPVQEKYDFVEKVITMLGMEEFAEAVVGFPGEGLNVEQRKLLTIGVELAAKPALLLFLDEPTSGLDSQSSWTIIALLRRLASSGQAILCTIHQPSAMLFQQFDRLLFLAKGGRTVYFGDIGPNSRTMLDYFETKGARRCNDSENPAEYILEIAGAGVNGKAEQDWPTVWKESSEFTQMMSALEKKCSAVGYTNNTDNQGESEGTEDAFAMPFGDQFAAVLRRIFQQYWRSPEYIYGKLALGILSALFVGFSFYIPGTSQQGLQSSIFSVFMITAIFTALVQQIMPQFIFQRDLYEVREQPSKTYHWAAFLGANLLAEIPYQMFVAILVYASFVYPVYGIADSQRQGIMLLLIIQFFIYGSTFAHAVVAVLPNAETAGLIATMLFNMTLVFNGILVPRVALPGFWDFMYRISPMTYLVNAIIASGVSGRAVNCSEKELSVFSVAPGYDTCGQYLEAYLEAAGTAAGKLLNPESTDQCKYCTLQTADQFLASRDIYYDQRWRNFGLLWAYIAFNAAFAFAIYYLCRVRSWKSKA